MHTTTMTGRPRIAAGKLTIGIILLAIGVATFLETIDVWDSGSLWSYWPLLLIAIGAANELDAIRDRRRDGSFILLAVGIWMLVGSFGIFGLSYREAFPIAVVVAGLGIILHAVIDRPASLAGKENNHE